MYRLMQLKSDVITTDLT